MPLDPDFISANLQTNNETDTKDFFENRLFYKSAAFDEIGVQPIDTWEEKPYYGLVDLNYYPVYVSDGKALERIDNSEIRCFDFVADAFNAMRGYWNNLLIHDRISEDSLFAELNPVKGWQNFLQIYNAYIEAYLINFTNFASSHDQDKKIKNFDDFINLFKAFIKNSKSIPLSKTSVILSNSISILASGLSLELLDYDYDDDLVKFEEVISDSNFEFLAIIARKYGFRIDKNIPWRLVADIGSEEMQEFMKNRQVTGGTSAEIKKNLFSSRFKRACLDEISDWRKRMISLYNAFVDERPIIRIKEAEQSKRHSALSSKTIIIRRQPVSEKNLSLKFDDRYWLNLYVDIRNHETKKFKNPKKYENFKKRINLMVRKAKKRLDISKALMYTESKMKTCPKFSYEISPALTEEQLEELELEYIQFFS
jgi:hypothetical protein